MEGNEFNFEKDYNWALLVAAISPEGRSWIEAYAEENEIRNWIRESLAFMRKRQLQSAMRLLDQAQTRWESLQYTAPGIYHVIGRYYYGALAYYEYCTGNFEQADHILVETLNSIRQAVESEACLLPFSAVAMDVPLKQAQITRALGRWREMRHRLIEVREMALDQRPMFVLENGTPIFHHTLASPFLIHPLGNGASTSLQYLTDDTLRLQVFNQWVEILYALPNFLIPYP